MENVYIRAKDELNKRFERFRQMVSLYGGLETAKRLIAKNGLSDGFEDLTVEKRLDLSMERIVLKEKYRPLFTDEERAICDKRLSECGYNWRRDGL